MRRLIGLVFVAVGLACLSLFALQVYARVGFQRDQNAVLEAMLADRGHTPALGTVARHDIVGRLEIPRLRLTTIVVEGDDEETLRRAVGHLPDTALPWEQGNSAMAGHRDTFFRALRNVHPGDEVHFTSPRGRFTYRVRETRITTPDDVHVLAASSRDELTLLTCYPFTYIGSAPNRYVVRAERIEAE